MKNAKTKTNAKDDAGTLRWLLAAGRGGIRRIERLGWKRLAGPSGVGKLGLPDSKTRGCLLKPRGPGAIVGRAVRVAK